MKKIAWAGLNEFTYKKLGENPEIKRIMDKLSAEKDASTEKKVVVSKLDVNEGEKIELKFKPDGEAYNGVVEKDMNGNLYIATEEGPGYIDQAIEIKKIIREIDKKDDMKAPMDSMTDIDEKAMPPIAPEPVKKDIKKKAQEEGYDKIMASLYIWGDYDDQVEMNVSDFAEMKELSAMSGQLEGLNIRKEDEDYDFYAEEVDEDGYPGKAIYAVPHHTVFMQRFVGQEPNASLKKKAQEEGLKKGDVVEHIRFGKGTVTNIDTTTYSIPMITALYDKGEIVASASEIKKVEASLNKKAEQPWGEFNSLQEAHDWLSNGRGHGDEFVAEAALIVWKDMFGDTDPSGEKGTPEQISTYANAVHEKAKEYGQTTEASLNKEAQEDMDLPEVVEQLSLMQDKDAAMRKLTSYLIEKQGNESEKKGIEFGMYPEKYTQMAEKLLAGGDAMPEFENYASKDIIKIARNYAKDFMDEPDLTEWNKLDSIYKMLDRRITNLENQNTERGMKFNHGIDYSQREKLDKQRGGIVDKYMNSITNYFKQPREQAVEEVVARFNKKGEKPKPWGKIRDYKKKDTVQHVKKKREDELSSIPGGQNTNEFNQMNKLDADPNELGGHGRE